MRGCDRVQLHNPVIGSTIAGVACVRRLLPGTTNAGKQFLSFEISNATGASGGKVWAEHLTKWDGIRLGQPVHVVAKVKPGYKGGPPELHVTQIEPLRSDHPVALELNPICPVPLHDLKERRLHLLSCLTAKGLVLHEVVLEQVGPERWLNCPAAKSHHHHYIHGLAEHSIEVAELAIALAQASPAGEHIDYDALIVGALLHDSGKVLEYTWESSAIDLSRRGRLSYHTVSGVALVASAAVRGAERLAEAGVSELAIDHLMHVITSHHGQRDWGSPVEPVSLEALFIHIADLASARGRTMLDDLTSDALGPDGWVIPTAWGRKPVFSLRRALAGTAVDVQTQSRDGAVPEAQLGEGSASEDLPYRIVAFLRVLTDAESSSPAP